MDKHTYFNKLSGALTVAGAHRPALVVDKQRLNHNIKQLKSVLDKGFAYRLVAKSLPSLPMIQYIMDKTGTNRLMSFHLPFVNHLIEELPHVDILLGKPMPVAAVEQFYKPLTAGVAASGFDSARQMHWLTDSESRLIQYIELAKKLNCRLNINLEIDVGLHRGGYADIKSFISSLSLIKENSKFVVLTGLMGYEAHICKIPALLGGPQKAFVESQKTYQAFITAVINVMGSVDDLVLNAGGSSTYPYYENTSIINEVATASALVKPTDFDVFTLDHHESATYIAAPVLKDVKSPEIPMAKGLSSVMKAIGLLPSKACYIYGGNWLAKPEFPEGVRHCNMMGHSSNQEMYEIPKDVELNADDYLFFRPSQSEAVFLQFGEIAVYDNGVIVDWWSVFPSERP